MPQLDVRAPPTRVRVKFFTRAEGGRVSPPAGPSSLHLPYPYRPHIRIDSYDHDIWLRLDTFPDDKGWMEADAIIAESAGELEQGHEYPLYEGAKMKVGLVMRP